MVISAYALAEGNDLLVSQSYSLFASDGKLAINFARPINYISHFPATRGQSVKFSLTELTPVSQAVTIEDRLIVSKNDTNPVTDILYEQENGSTGTLTVHFNRSVEYEYAISRDRKTLTLTLKNVANKRSTSSSRPLSSNLTIYELRLTTSTKPIDTSKQPALKNFRDYDIYTSEYISETSKVYTLHLGYFYSLSVAKTNQQKLKPFYPYSWVSKIEPEQYKTAETWFLNKRLQQLAKDKRASKVKPDKAHILMERAKQAMLDNNYRQAIRYFTRVLQLGNQEFAQEALELLGVAREKNGQFAHAKAEYEAYLKKYPEGEDHERVKQRLLGLITARSAPKEKLENGVKVAEPEWEFFGSVYQFYRRQVSSTDVTPTITTDSSLLTDVLFSGRKRGFEYNHRFNIAGSNRYDFLDDTDPSDGRLHTFYYDISKLDGDHSGRIGRQTHSSDGVLGRFDGAVLHKKFSTNRQFNLLAGYPVELYNQDGVNTERLFYAMSVDFDSFYKDADLNLYYMKQSNGNFTDREAIGTQIKYLDSHRSYFMTMDYDIFFSELNQVTFIGNWRNESNSSINVIADHRKSPLLTTNNALIGQTVPSLAQLTTTYTTDEIYQIAKDRTTSYSALTVTGSTYLSERYQLNGDVTFSRLDGTPASASVPASEGTDTETFYHTSLVINQFFSNSDITIFGARYGNATSSKIIQLNFSSNFNLQRKWRINPRLVYDHRNNSNGTSRTTWKPRLILSYRSSRSLKYEMDLGYETAETTSATTSDKENNLYVFIGYLYDF